MSRYDIGLCQRFSTLIHGYNPETSSPNIQNHYLCLVILKSDSEFSHIRFITELTKSSPTPCSLEIVETDVLYPGGEMVAIYKTFWLRILQKKVRRWLKVKRAIQTNHIIQMLILREYTGCKLLFQ